MKCHVISVFCTAICCPYNSSETTLLTVSTRQCDKVRLPASFENRHCVSSTRAAAH